MALAILCVASVLIGWFVAGRVLSPLRTMTASARAISSAEPRAASRPGRSRRRAEGPRGDVRRSPGPARTIIRGATAVRRQRIARAPDTARARARPGPVRARRSGADAGRLACHIRANSRRGAAAGRTPRGAVHAGPRRARSRASGAGRPRRGRGVCAARARPGSRGARAAHRYQPAARGRGGRSAPARRDSPPTWSTTPFDTTSQTAASTS